MINFSEKLNSYAPFNYRKEDNFVSRSAQPQASNLIWLKTEGVTDIFNLRTMVVPKLNFNEETEVKNLGMNYHNYPITEDFLNNENIKNLTNFFGKLFNDMAELIESGKNLHIHCKAGADRTGSVCFIYKTLNGIDSVQNNEKEMLEMGHNQRIYPNVINMLKKVCQNLITNV